MAERDALRRYIIEEADAERYVPPRHAGTTNLLYLAAEQVGSRQFEVVVGKPARGGGGDPHFHDRTEQIVFVLQGRGLSEMEGEQFEIGPQLGSERGTCALDPIGRHVKRQLFAVVAEQVEAGQEVVRRRGVDPDPEFPLRRREVEDFQDQPNVDRRLH